MGGAQRYPSPRAPALMGIAEPVIGRAFARPRWLHPFYDTHSRSRGPKSPRFCIDAVPQKREQGMPGACCTRGLACKGQKESCTRAYRYRRNTPAFPAQGKINSPVKFYGAVCSSQLIDEPHDLPISFNTPPQAFTDTIATLRENGDTNFMARKVSFSAMESRSARLNKFTIRRRPYSGPTLARGILLLYRRNKTNGTWVLKVSDGHGAYWTKGFALADDFEDADEKNVLTFYQAQDQAKKLARGGDGNA